MLFLPPYGVVLDGATPTAAMLISETVTLRCKQGRIGTAERLCAGDHTATFVL